ncbi:hypothetical protein [Hyphomicrobium sp.]|uniref:hypothetical protein n=1 Tax=Hyphomicrobium sp. TaxID=82 RepID=UPI000FA0815A|nr:hypothetical protein [Hyphomicrobium sp.]RUP00170.1 MAG: hypothetical protein EKK30_03405 [Hyphomicrobium sp.]
MVDDDFKFDAGTMGRLAGALSFVVGADHEATKALKTAAETGTAKDIKAARTQFLRLKPGDRRAALTMLND